MANIKYRVNEPYLEGNTAKYVLEVVEKRWLSVRGFHTREFERMFAEMAGVPHALAVCSGTASLHTALLAMGVTAGDRVIIPNYTCGACATSVIQAGGVPVIVDVERDTFGLEAGAVEEALQATQAKVVMLVHCYGFPARDTVAIVKLCEKYGALLLEDASEAHGAEIDGKRVGSFGTMSCFSCRSDKMVGIGEGGMVLSANQELMDKALYFASRAAPFRGPDDDYWRAYCYTGVGMNYLLPHLAGAVGHAQMEQFPEILRRKRAVGQAYQKLFAEAGFKTQKITSGADPVFWVNFVIFENMDEDEVHGVGNELMRRGIEIRPAFWPLSLLPVFESGRFGEQAVGQYLFEKGFVVPSSVYLADNDCAAVRDIVGEIKAVAG